MGASGKHLPGNLQGPAVPEKLRRFDMAAGHRSFQDAKAAAAKRAAERGIDVAVMRTGGRRLPFAISPGRYGIQVLLNVRPDGSIYPAQAGQNRPRLSAEEKRSRMAAEHRREMARYRVSFRG